MIDTVMTNEVIKIDIVPIVETGDITDKIEVDLHLNKVLEEEILEVMQGGINIMEDSRGRVQR